MTREEAYRILEIREDAEEAAIKKKYRALMRKVHPDGEAFRKKDADYLFTARDLNEAYGILCADLQERGQRTGRRSRSGTSGEGKGTQRNRERSGFQDNTEDDRMKTSHRRSRKPQENWKAPINERAYRSRKVFHEVEDEDGERIGEICVAEGKFYQTEDESFSMFLKSMFTLSKEMLDEIDADCDGTMEREKRFAMQAELSYLLAGQFLDGTLLLKQLAVREDGADTRVYRITAMLERNGEKIEGIHLHPKAIRQHKLYMQDEEGKEVGYLSFLDDRLYYVIIPLFEQRLVQVKTEVVLGNGVKGRRQRGANYQEVNLWLRFTEKTAQEYPDNTVQRIENLLREYRSRIVV